MVRLPYQSAGRAIIPATGTVQRRSVPAPQTTTATAIGSRARNGIGMAAHVPSRLLLVGDGPDLSDALDLARELGVGDSVDALGEQDPVTPLLSVSDLFLLPSAQESFGLSALEAMACGVPVVASNVGGLPEVVEHGTSGFLHSPEDIDGMAANGIALLTNPEMHASFAERGRRVVTERFCADLIVPQYEAFYERLLSERR